MHHSRVHCGVFAGAHREHVTVITEKGECMVTTDLLSTRSSLLAMHACSWAQDWQGVGEGHDGAARGLCEAHASQLGAYIHIVKRGEAHQEHVRRLCLALVVPTSAPALPASRAAQQVGGGLGSSERITSASQHYRCTRHSHRPPLHHPVNRCLGCGTRQQRHTCRRLWCALPPPCP